MPRSTKTKKWDANDPQRYRYELATMGCRTRVFENVAGEKSSLGRGNLSFTTLNMPRLAIEARIKAENMTEDGHNKDAVERKAKEIFIESIHETATLIAEQLYERYQYQRTALARQFPFMMGNDVWKGGAALNPNEQVGDVLRSGTLGIGFLGGHNAMVALYGEGHGHSQKAWDTLYEAVLEINKVADEYKAKYNLNYSVLATPAEGLSGRFTRMDRRKYRKNQRSDRQRLLCQFFPCGCKRTDQHCRENKKRGSVPRHHPRRTHHLCGTGRRSPEKRTRHCQDRKSYV